MAREVIGIRTMRTNGSVVGCDVGVSICKCRQCPTRSPMCAPKPTANNHLIRHFKLCRMLVHFMVRGASDRRLREIVKMPGGRRGDGGRQPMVSVHHILSAEQLHEKAQVTPSSHLVSRSLLNDNESWSMDGCKASPPDPKFLKIGCHPSPGQPLAFALPTTRVSPQQ
ncbi:hypothetical protein ASPTUDRAFT_735741 [Aspergillus tubingensis CBS 134.48]|uniref:Uncharacterized protein n=1 Tax=Aspergillus tubingensis (strain CBS 134.48) TaxID=767770 RepID=A0A1L9MXS1_ASPTC|nr:hypothetical protein ASPTUDRAFT_735741 [Aspergillus tubingensis CBS 134.48]